MSEHPVITACIGIMILLAFAILKWKKRKGASTDALVTLTALENAAAIVTEHAAELTIHRKQLTTTLKDGRVDDSKWLEERDLFIYQIVEPQDGNITNSLERLLAVWQMIDDATAEFAALHTTEPPVPSVATGDRNDSLLHVPSEATAIGRAA